MKSIDTYLTSSTPFTNPPLNTKSGNKTERKGGATIAVNVANPPPGVRYAGNPCPGYAKIARNLSTQTLAKEEPTPPNPMIATTQNKTL